MGKPDGIPQEPATGQKDWLIHCTEGNATSEYAFHIDREPAVANPTSSVVSPAMRNSHGRKQRQRPHPTRWAAWSCC